MARPAAAFDRFDFRADDKVTDELKRPYSDGTTHVVFEPHELIEKLAALVPFPRKNLVRYRGVLAPNATWRRHVVPKPPQPSPTKESGRRRR